MSCISRTRASNAHSRVAAVKKIRNMYYNGTVHFNALICLPKSTRVGGKKLGCLLSVYSVCSDEGNRIAVALSTKSVKVYDAITLEIKAHVSISISRF